MNKNEVIKELKEKYPDANIFLNDEQEPTEIVAEVDPENGVAIAVVDRSVEHHHNHTVERYVVLRGLLELRVNGVKHLMKEGDEKEIAPGQVHYAIGDQTLVECISTPPWDPEDHILEDPEGNK